MTQRYQMLRTIIVRIIIILLTSIGALALSVPLKAAVSTTTRTPVSPTTVSPIAPATITTSPPLSSTPTSPISPPNLLPSLLAQISLAAPGERLTDFMLDRDSARLYVSDSGGQLHVLDAHTGAKIADLPAAGELTLDAANHHLYASAADWSKVTVVNTSALTVTGVISPGGLVVVDSKRHRVYVGGQMYDGVTLTKWGQGSQPGIQAYNPIRDELYLVNYTLYAANPETLEITRDLLPEIMASPGATFVGATNVYDAYIFPERNVLLVNTYSAAAGKGITSKSPRFFDATTLVELSDPAQHPAVEYNCEHWNIIEQGRPILAEPVGSYIYREQAFSYYQTFVNLLVYDRQGNLVTRRDGLPLGLTNPNTRQMYILYPRGVLVLDLTTLSPLGTLPALSCLFLDKEMGRIYGFHNEDLLVFSEMGGQPERLPPARVETLAKAAITFIQPSPDYGHDQTLFVGQAGRLYRSQDGGQTWAHLRNGLPELGDEVTRGLALSPDFAHDRTLFTYGYKSTFHGEGIYRSSDGGDSWQPMWQGLTDLRVYNVILSPNYAADGTLLAYAQTGLNSYDYSLFSSADRGLTWTPVMTAANPSLLPAATELLPLTEPLIRFRSGGSSPLERTRDGGQTWEPVFKQFTIDKVLLSPNFATDQTVYAFSYSLLRSVDAGETWQIWSDDRLVGRDSSNALSAIAVSPILNNGQHLLFIGTNAGEFWSLNPAKITWEPFPASK